jgi:hypothetical protein
MFDRLFFRSYALTRQLSTPLVTPSISSSMRGARNVQVHSADESSPFAVNRRVSEIGRAAQRHNQPSGDQKSGKPMVESQLPFAGKLACQAVAAIFHGTGGWMLDLSQPSPDCAQAGNGLGTDVGGIQRLHGRRPRSFTILRLTHGYELDRLIVWPSGCK